jgi:hypothetical protein
MVFVLFSAFFGSATLVLCLLNDLRLGDGYDFFGKSVDAKLIVRLVGLSGPLLVFYALNHPPWSRDRWITVTGAICGGLFVHLPVFFYLDRDICPYVAVVLVGNMISLLVTIKGKGFNAILDWYK